ncbi:hypothetical protein [Sphingobacterium detergens]|uniref:hypothetical protein n=1 Tax=Sphingobacterium detergens TaxID=1145106 RepID=UPI000E70843E|nr:hypothetical protein [Sphingobacterium detergens]
MFILFSNDKTCYELPINAERDQKEPIRSFTVEAFEMAALAIHDNAHPVSSLYEMFPITGSSPTAMKKNEVLLSAGQTIASFI